MDRLGIEEGEGVLRVRRTRWEALLLRRSLLRLLVVVAGVAVWGLVGVVDARAAGGPVGSGSVFGLPDTTAGEAGNLLANGSFVSSAAGWVGWQSSLSRLAGGRLDAGALEVAPQAGMSG